MLNFERNEKCWCGSGKKYKICHQAKDTEKLLPLARQGYKIPTRDLILTPEQIEGIRKSGKLTAKILDEVTPLVKEGVSTEELNDFIHKMTIEKGAIPAPLNYNGFPKSCCTSINDVICHGIPNKKDILKNGDILNIDVTSILNGYYADMSRMFLIGEVSEEAKRLVEFTKSCLDIAIETVKPYDSVSVIGSKIHDMADASGYSVVRALTGHGTGLKFHTEPTVEHFRTNEKSMILVPGMVFTIEPMINQGSYDCEILEDDWTVVTKDGKLSAQWEHTLVMTETGCEILTK